MESAGSGGLGRDFCRHRKNFEAGKNTIPAVATAIERTLTEAGIEFIRPDNGGDGVRWRKPR